MHLSVGTNYEFDDDCVQVFDTATKNIFTSAAAINDEVVSRDTTTEEAPPASRPHIENLKRATNRRREKRRLAEPTSVEFDVDTAFIWDDFLQAEVRVGQERHLMFATANQLSVQQKVTIVVVKTVH